MPDNPDVRRNLSINGDNDRTVQNTRAKFLSGDNPVDMDYTDVVNMFIKLGGLIMQAVSDERSVIIEKHEVDQIIQEYTT